MQGLEARLRRGQEDQRHREHPGDRREVLARIVVDLLVERLVDGHRAAAHDQCVAIGRGLRGDFHADIAAGAGAVFHHDGLAELLAEPLGQGAREDVGGLSGREGHDQLDGTVRIGGVGGAGDAQQQGHKGGARRLQLNLLKQWAMT
ncbi:hypothetical protein D3C81_1258790 [compost metagenome]